VQREKLIEETFLNTLKKRPGSITFKNYTTSARSLADLLSGNQPTIFHDTSDWNPQPKLMQDLIGGKIPDIVLRSKVSSENRIYIEVKDSTPLSDGVADSQVVRYFLHLLGMTTKVPRPGKTDIRRAVLLCAPSDWFKNKRNAERWNYFLEHFSGLAKEFDIALGELNSESL
jgi:hypothetical protein